MRCGCCGTYAGFPISGASAMPNMPRCSRRSSTFLHQDGVGPRRLAGAPGQAHRPNRWRHRHVVQAVGVYPHMDLRRAAPRLDRDESHWRDATRAVEDRLSDALHERLTQRFVDRRTSVLLRRLKQKESLVAEVNDKGEVTRRGAVCRPARRVPVPPGRDRDAGRGQDASRRRAGRADAGVPPARRTASTTRPIPRSTLPNRAG